MKMIKNRSSNISKTKKAKSLRSLTHYQNWKITLEWEKKCKNFNLNTRPATAQKIWKDATMVSKDGLMKETAIRPSRMLMLTKPNYSKINPTQPTPLCSSVKI